MASHRQPEGAKIPRHVGIIMDGNGRWAKLHGLPRLEGHRRGADRARDVVSWAIELGIRELSLYAFSTENWDRPREEVSGLMGILATLLPKQLPEMQKQGVRLKVLGDVSALPDRARKAVEKCCAETSGNSTIDLILCLNYGGQQEILAGVRRACSWAMQQHDPEAALADLDAHRFRNFLWRADLSPVDLLIRTGGEQRISNFHLWDVAYAELYFSDIYWPEYNRDELAAALNAFASRERRFGLTGEQVRS